VTFKDCFNNWKPIQSEYVVIPKSSKTPSASPRLQV